MEKQEDRPVMEKIDTSGPEYSSKYICPMHCKGSGSDQPGVCPVCGMDYELKN
jgi:rubrerythrin